MGAYSASVLADTPYLYWRLDETGGTTAADASGNGRTGTYSGSPDLGEAGLVDDGTAVHFNEGATGVGTEYCSSASLSWGSFTAFSLEIVVNPSGPIDAIQHIVYGPHPIFQDRNNLKISVAGGARYTFGFYDLGAAQASVTSDTAAVVGERAHILFTVTNGGFARLYICGVLEDEYDMVGNFAFTDGAFILAGTDDTAVENRFRGVADEFALYNYELSQARALAHCNAMVPRRCDLNPEDEVLFVDASAGDITVRLFPDDPLAEGPIRYIKRIDGTTNTVTIDPGATTIDRQDSMILMPRDAIAIITDGTEWWVI